MTDVEKMLEPRAKVVVIVVEGKQEFALRGSLTFPAGHVLGASKVCLAVHAATSPWISCYLQNFTTGCR